MCRNMNEFSESFLKLIESKWPKWKGIAKPVGEYFEFEVSSPEDNELQLMIDTDEDEVTIGFGYYHCHWDGLGFESVEDEWEDAIQFIEGIVNNSIIVVSWFKESKWCGSSWVKAGEIYTPDCAYDELVYQSWFGGT